MCSDTISKLKTQEIIQLEKTIADRGLNYRQYADLIGVGYQVLLNARRGKGIMKRTIDIILADMKSEKPIISQLNKLIAGKTPEVKKKIEQEYYVNYELAIMMSEQCQTLKECNDILKMYSNNNISKSSTVILETNAIL